MPASEIGPLLDRLAHEPAEEEDVYLIPEDMEMETKLAEMDMGALNGERHVGTPSVFGCPECGGVLWKYKMES
ncbi:MAG TPA: hypothetical protein VH593_22310 [Ktedonobacteraceae bacterium]